MLKNTSNEDGTNRVTVAPWQRKSRPRMLVVSKAAFLGNYLAVSTLNGSSTEYHGKKHQPFSLSCVIVVFGSRAIQISG